LDKAKPCVLNLTFPFDLTRDQLAAVDAWVSNGYKGSIISALEQEKQRLRMNARKEELLKILLITMQKMLMLAVIVVLGMPKVLYHRYSF
jgi:hypothetical protein